MLMVPGWGPGDGVAGDDPPHDSEVKTNTPQTTMRRMCLLRA
jgi:hypothetical protein